MICAAWRMICGRMAAANPVIGYVSFRMRQKTADGPDGTDASGGWKRQQTDGN